MQCYDDTQLGWFPGFIGTYTCQIDQNGNIEVPERYIELLRREEDKPNEAILVFIGELRIYPCKMFDRMASDFCIEIKEMNASEEDICVQRVVYDQVGVMHLPKEMCEKAGVNFPLEVQLLGCETFFAIDVT